MNWLEVSLIVSPEAAEAVSEVLGRFVGDNVVITSTQIDHESDVEGHPVGPVQVCAYLEADAGLELRREQLEQSLWHLGQILPLPAPVYRPVAESDWAENWKVNFKPVRAGRHLVVVPDWLFADYPAAAGDVLIRLDPGMAFGTGAHPTTRLCLAAIERHMQPGASVLDLGTGSGILAIAAAKLGARQVTGVDIDADAVRVAVENLAANGVADRVQAAAGSLAEVLAGLAAPAELVVANILAKVLVDLLDQGLACTVTPGGLLVLSGILDSQAYQVRAALTRHGLEFLAQEQEEDWVALIARQPA